jgi:hypothetical protein
MQGLGAFVRVAYGVASFSTCAFASAQGPGTAASHGLAFGRLERAEDPMHPGEGSAELT